MDVRVQNSLETSQKKSPLADFIDSQASKIQEIIPKETVNIDRFLQSAKLAIFNPKTPLLAQCDPLSIYRSLKEAAQYGLEIGGVLGQAYLIPYNESFSDGKGGWKKTMTCHFQIGYKGLIALARRSKTIKTISVECVYENDTFEVQLGSGRTIIHTFNLSKERGDVIGYYCMVELQNEGIQFAAMTKKQVEDHRDKFSKAYKKDDKESNWNKNFDSMALKTCVIKALKLCPISIEALEAVRNEEAGETNCENVTPQKSSTQQNKKSVSVENKVDVETAQIVDFDDDGIDAAFDQQAMQHEHGTPVDLF
ncbi:MAG: recombinase RecT [Treponemataceae bacterium]